MGMIFDLYIKHLPDTGAVFEYRPGAPDIPDSDIGSAFERLDEDIAKYEKASHPQNRIYVKKYREMCL